MENIAIIFNEPSLVRTNFEEKLKAALSEKCWIIEDGAVKECALHEFQWLIENRLHSRGLGFAYAPFNVGGDKWAVARFYQSGRVSYRDAFLTMDEAFDAAIDGYVLDIYENDEFTVFSSRSSAEDFLLKENV